MNTTHSLVWFGHNLVTTLYEIYFKSKFCSFRVLNQEFGGKSENIGGHLGTRFLDVCGKYKITVSLCYLKLWPIPEKAKRCELQDKGHSAAPSQFLVAGCDWEVQSLTNFPPVTHSPHSPPNSPPTFPFSRWCWKTSCTGSLYLLKARTGKHFHQFYFAEGCKIYFSEGCTNEMFRRFCIILIVALLGKV